MQTVGKWGWAAKSLVLGASGTPSHGEGGEAPKPLVLEHLFGVFPHCAGLFLHYSEHPGRVVGMCWWSSTPRSPNFVTIAFAPLLGRVSYQQTLLAPARVPREPLEVLPPYPSRSPSIPAALGIAGCLLAGDAADCHPSGGGGFAEVLCLSPAPREDGEVRGDAAMAAAAADIPSAAAPFQRGCEWILRR